MDNMNHTDTCHAFTLGMQTFDQSNGVQGTWADSPEHLALKSTSLGYGEYRYQYHQYVFCALMMSVFIHYIQTFIQYIGISISYEEQEVIGQLSCIPNLQWGKKVFLLLKKMREACNLIQSKVMSNV